MARRDHEDELTARQRPGLERAVPSTVPGRDGDLMVSTKSGGLVGVATREATAFVSVNGVEAELDERELRAAMVAIGAALGRISRG